MLTLRLEHNGEHDFSEYCSQYSYMFKYFYSHAELMPDEETNTFIRTGCPLLDSWFVQSCKTMVLGKLNQFDTIVKQRHEDYEDIVERLLEDEFKNKKERNKAVLKMKRLQLHFDDKIVFGTVSLSREITNLCNRKLSIDYLNKLIRENDSNKNDKLITKTKKKIGKYHQLDSDGVSKI